ncbi:MAG: DUF2164 domain-containing protein [Rubrivivax sp.]|nr:DUF2164 domain-containing protein [Rubrivivax sp.]
MAITLDKPTKEAAVASIQRWFETERDERIGNIAAMGLLSFFLEEIAPSVYNAAVAEVQERLQARIAELDLEIHEDEFSYFKKRAAAAASKGRR